MKKTSKKIEMPKVTFTTVNTDVDAILEELVDWSKNRSSENLKLDQPQYKPTQAEEIEITRWLNQDKKPKQRP